MKLKSRGSSRVGEALTAAIQGKGSCRPEVPLPEVIDLAAIAKLLPGEEIAALRMQQFDFVLFSPQGQPVLAIAFDGPTHSNVKKRRADLRKNHACWLAKLPIQRFRTEHVQPHDKTALVDWAFQRYVAWNEHIESDDFGFEFDDPRF